MAFFTFSQNNPFGSFVIDHDRGISGYVIVEAEHQAGAIWYMENALGVVFYGNECECCGSRWSYPCDEADEPVIYGEPVSDFVPSGMRVEHGFAGYVHYGDGRVAPFGGEVEP